MAHILDGFNSAFARPTPPPEVTNVRSARPTPPPNEKLKALLGEFDASFEGEKPARNESPKAPPIAFNPAPSAPKAPVLARKSAVDLQAEFDGAFNPDGTWKDPSNAKPFTFMSAAPKKKDPEMAPATAPTMSGP